MTKVVETTIEVPEGFASALVARSIWALDDQTRRLFEALEGATVEELGWQLAPGTNTIGMIVAHLAVAEAHMAAVGVEGRTDSDVPGVLGITTNDDGFPLPEGGTPPTALAGKDLEWFRSLVVKARVETKRIARPISDADLARRIVRPPRPDGSQRVFDVQWMIYHLVEHFCGHHGQVLLLRHLYRATRTRA